MSKTKSVPLDVKLAKKLWAQVNAEAMADAKEAVDILSQEQRLELFAKFCSGCGTEDPRCLCTKDE